MFVPYRFIEIKETSCVTVAMVGPSSHYYDDEYLIQSYIDT